MSKSKIQFFDVIAIRAATKTFNDAHDKTDLVTIAEIPGRSPCTRLQRTVVEHSDPEGDGTITDIKQIGAKPAHSGCKLQALLTSELSANPTPSPR